jgi:glycosidase
MPWHGGAHAGFGRAGAPAPWLPLHPQSAVLHVEGQQQDPDSLLTCYRRMLLLRRASPALSGGALELCEPLGDPRRVLAFRRVHQDEEALVLLNFSRKETPVDLRGHPNRVLFSNLVDESFQGFGRQILRPWEGIILFSRPS